MDHTSLPILTDSIKFSLLKNKFHKPVWSTISCFTR